MDAHDKANEIVKEVINSDLHQEIVKEVDTIMKKQNCSLMDALLILANKVVEDKNV